MAAAMQRFLRRASFLQPLCLFHLCRLQVPTSPFRGCEWNAQEELRTTTHFRLYVDAAVVQLQNAVGHCQADPAAAALSGEVEVEDFLPDLRRNADSVISDAQDRHSALFFK